MWGIKSQPASISASGFPALYISSRISAGCSKVELYWDYSVSVISLNIMLMFWLIKPELGKLKPKKLNESED